MLKNLTRANYQEFINEFANSHSKETIRKLNGYIKSSFDDAVFDGLMKKNIVHKITFNGRNPQKSESEKFINLNDFEKLKKEVKKSNSDSSLILYIMIVTGCRVSGALNLKREYINQVKRELYIDERKTDTSPRWIEISDSDMSYIIKSLEQHPISIDGYFFKQYGKFITINAINKQLARHCENIKINRITSHALRHTHCSYLLAKDISIHYISKRLGHKNIAVTTEIYSHLLKEKYIEENKKAVEALKVL